MITRVIATAGHVDHGKSSLVHALTGTHPDRFEEERRRGLTVDLGFAHTSLGSGAVVSFIDVPGHARFLRNMLAGVGAVAGCLFVVAANEGWKPQSEEHLRILQLLGVTNGVIALTKTDLVDDELLEIATVDVSEHVAGSFLRDAPIVPVAAQRGDGLTELRAALNDLVRQVPEPVDAGRPRLWVDRAFTIRGSGTVVTGTLIGGRLAAGDVVVVEPRARHARIRSMQSHGITLDTIGPGTRVALNLVGVRRTEVQRGDVVVHARRWRTSDHVDVSLSTLPGLDRPVGRRGAYIAYIGSREVPVRLRLIGEPELASGAAACARLFLPCHLPMVPGDRFVLREAGRSVTIGGGEVLDIDPVKRVSKAAPDRSIERVVAERGWVEVSEVEMLTGQVVAPVIGRWTVSEAELAATRARLLEAVRDAGDLGLVLAMLPEHERAVLAGLVEVVIDAGHARLAGAPDPFEHHPLATAILAGGFRPVVPPDTDRATVRELAKRGVLVECDGILFHAETIRATAAFATQLLAEQPTGFTVSSFCQRADTTRKFALALLTALDGRGVTRRRGDVRVAGPRLEADARR
jgi:selenocysteine-specific elongation factor